MEWNNKIIQNNISWKCLRNICIAIELPKSSMPGPAIDIIYLKYFRENICLHRCQNKLRYRIGDQVRYDEKKSGCQNEIVDLSKIWSCHTTSILCPLQETQFYAGADMLSTFRSQLLSRLAHRAAISCSLLNLIDVTMSMTVCVYSSQTDIELLVESHRQRLLVTFVQQQIWMAEVILHRSPFNLVVIKQHRLPWSFAPQ